MMVEKIVTLNNKSRKGDYIYIKEKNSPARYYRIGSKDVKEYYDLKYNKKILRQNYANYSKGKKLYKDFLNDKEIKPKDKRVLRRYIDDYKEYGKVNQSTFRKQLKKTIGEDPIYVKRRLRDERGKEIKLRNNRYKVVTRNKNPNFPSQFCIVLRITLRMRNKSITKTVNGYASIQFSRTHSIDIVRKKAIENGISTFLIQTGLKTGTPELRNRLTYRIIDEFWIAYVDYHSTIINRI